MIFSENKLVYETSPSVTGNLKLMLTNEDFYLSFMESTHESSYNPLINPIKNKIPINKSKSYFENIFEKILNPVDSRSVPDSNGIPRPMARVYRYNEFPALEIFQNDDSTGLEFKARPKKLLLSDYKERYSYFAPLYIFSDNDNNITLPDYFVVFRLDNFTFSDQFTLMDNSTNFDIFLKDKLKNAELVHSYKLKGSDFETWIKKNKFKNTYYETIANEDFSLYYHGFKIDLDFYDNVNKYRLFFQNSSDKTDMEKIFEQAQQEKILNTNVFNLEFPFNWEDDKIFPNENNFFGMYINTEELTELGFTLDVPKLNETLSVKIDESKITLSEETYFNIIEKDNSVEFPIKVKDSPSIFSVISNSSNVFLTLDKNKNLYNIKSLVKDSTEHKYLKLNSSKDINLAKFYGFDQEAINISGRIVEDDIPTNVRLKFVKRKLNLFANSDYLSIRTDLFKDVEWRIVVNNSDEILYDTTKTYWNEGETLIFKSSNLTFTSLNSTDKKLTVIIPGFYSDFEDFQKIKLSYNEFNEVEYEIFDVVYNPENDETKFSVLDTGTENFTKSYLISEIKFKYKSPNYYFTYFNSYGNLDNVMNNISKAFNMFEYRLVDCNYINGELFFEAIDTKDAYNKIYLTGSLAYSNPNLSDVYINGKNPVTTKVLTSTDVVIFEKKYFKQELFHFSGYNKNTFFLENDYIKEIDNSEITPGDVLIQHKNSVEPLKHYDITGIRNWHSNYNQRFLEGNLYFTDTDKDDIFINSYGGLTGLKKSKYKIDRIIPIDIEKISIKNNCVEGSLSLELCRTASPVTPPPAPSLSNPYRRWLSSTANSLIDDSGNSSDFINSIVNQPDWTVGVGSSINNAYRPYGNANPLAQTSNNEGRLYTSTYGFTTGWSVSFWANVQHVPGNVTGLLQISNVSLDNPHAITVGLGANSGADGSLFMNFQENSLSTYQENSTYPTSYWDNNSWNMITLTCDIGATQTTHKLYRNGALLLTSTITNTNWSPIGTPMFVFGTIKIFSVGEFRGNKTALNKIKLYNKVLLPTEVVTLYSGQL